MWPAGMDLFSQLHAMHEVQHVHIREQHMDFIGTRFECFKSNICIRGLKHLKAGLLRLISGRPAHQQFVPSRELPAT